MFQNVYARKFRCLYLGYGNYLSKYILSFPVPPNPRPPHMPFLFGNPQVKAKGNKLLMAKDYEGAEKCYTEALELSPTGPNSHVYLCNRAAALCYLGRTDDAVVDCQESIDLNPNYAKAYTRLGYAFFQVTFHTGRIMV